MTKLTHLARDETELSQKILAGSRDPEDYLKLANLFVDTWHYDEAIELYDKALCLPLDNIGRARISVELGWILYEAGRQRKAEDLAKTAVSIVSNEPNTPEALFTKGAGQALLAYCVWLNDADFATESARSAIDCLQRVTLETPDFEEIAAAYCLAARLQHSLGETRHAILLSEKCLGLDLSAKDRVSCLTVYGEALRHENRFDEAEKAIKEALRYVRVDEALVLPTLYFELGLIQRLTNRLADAKENFEKTLDALAMHPALCQDSYLHVEVHWNLGAVYYNLEQYENAAAAYKQVIRYGDQNDSLGRDALLWLGHCFFVMGAYDDARQSYQKLLASPQLSRQQKAEAQEGIAKTYYQSGNYERALSEFQQVLLSYAVSDPYHSTVLISLGNCCEATADYSKAEDCFRKVLASPYASTADKASARRGLVENLAKSEFESKQYDRAVAAFEEALSNYTEGDSHRPNVLLWLGHCHEKTGAYPMARQCYEEVIASPLAIEADKISAQEGLSRLPSSPTKRYH